jgi:hypothetical protein
VIKLEILRDLPRFTAEDKLKKTEKGIINKD